MMFAKIFAFAVVMSACLLPVGSLQAQNPTVAITSLSAGAHLRPGTTIGVATNSSVVRVEYSIGATSYTGLVENYLGASTTAPFSFTWTGFPSSISLGRNLTLVVRAFDRNDRVATSQLWVVVPGSVGSSVLGAKNFAASAYWLTKNLNGASLAGIGYQSVVRGVTRLDNVGEAGEFTLSAPVAGRYEVTIRQYVLSGTKPSFSVAVNGQVVAASLPGVRTVTGWNNFGAADLNRAGITTITADLRQGVNLVKITSLSSGVLNIGNVSIAQPGQ
jgi:hypothetical protein